MLVLALEDGREIQTSRSCLGFCPNLLSSNRNILTVWVHRGARAKPLQTLWRAVVRGVTVLDVKVKRIRWRTGELENVKRLVAA